MRSDGGGRGRLGLVGKAVTFDTGGISIKPSNKLEEMKMDMSGGAAVIEATTAIARIGLPVNLLRSNDTRLAKRFRTIQIANRQIQFGMDLSNLRFLSLNLAN